MIHGIDVSSYQSSTYSIAGLDFVFVKATEGLSYVNPRMAAQAKRARDAGLVVGFYHYPHMANDPKAEADYFLKQAAIQAGDIIVLDWEGYDAANKSVPRSRQLAYRDAWLKYVKGKMPSRKVGMYCNTDYWLNVDTTSNCGDFLWIATAGKAAGQPGINHAWAFHQYSTAGGIDHDVANFTDRAALAAWARGTNTIPEDDMALTDDDAKKIADAVWAKALASPTAPAGTSPLRAAGTFLRWSDQHHADVIARLAALTAAVQAIASGGGLDAAEITAAAEAGAKAALAELGDALTN